MRERGGERETEHRIGEQAVTLEETTHYDSLFILLDTKKVVVGQRE